MKKMLNYLSRFETNRNLFGASVLILLSSATLLGLALQAEHRDAQLQRPAVTHAPFKLDQEVTMGAATMRLSNPSYTDGSGVFTAPEGKHYLIVDFSIKNFTDKPINVLPAADTYVKTSAGDVAYLSPFTLTNPFRPGELLPGEQINGQLSYLIPKKTAVKLFIDSVWSGGTLTFAIDKL